MEDIRSINFLYNQYILFVKSSKIHLIEISHQILYPLDSLLHTKKLRFTGSNHYILLSILQFFFPYFKGFDVQKKSML